MRAFLLLAILIQPVYHEASCPSVDPQRMTRMKRSVAEASGLLPAPDCHPEVRVRYLGIVHGGGSSQSASDGRIPVREYTRSDGTRVREHWRSEPSSSEGTAVVNVRSYTRADGTQVRGHTLSAPRDRD